MSSSDQSNQSRGNEFTRNVARYLAQQGLRLQPEYSVDVGLSSTHKKQHRFDLGNDSVLVECKYYAWTEGGNNPSAKISTLNEAMMLFFGAPSRYRKMLFIARTAKKGVRESETLAEYYVRLHRSSIPDDVEVWEFDGSALQASKLCG